MPPSHIVALNTEYYGRELILSGESKWNAAKTIDGKTTPMRNCSVIDVGEEFVPLLRDVFKSGLICFLKNEKLTHEGPISMEGFQLLKYDVDGEYIVHVDNNPTKPRDISGVLYLNDDYEGGELYFPKQDVLIKPVPGLLVLFPSYFTHPHECKKITKGTKYCVVSWFHFKEKPNGNSGTK